MNNKWEQLEVDFLIENYPKKGLDYCVKNLNRTKSSVLKKVRSLGVVRLIDQKYEKRCFSKIVKDSSNYTDLARKLGMSPFCGNRKTLKKYIAKYGLDVGHFDKGFSNFKTVVRKELGEVLVVNSDYNHTTNLKNRLFKEGLKKNLCELCGQEEIWHGKKMSLILDHINGVSNDNRLENLRIVCPNCNATLNTHGGRNIKNKNEGVV